MEQLDYGSRCMVCDVPLDGALGVVSHIAGIKRSRNNPNVCNRCNTHIVQGDIVDMTVVFADLSSFTELTHELGAERVSEVVDEFLQMASDILVEHDAFIDKYIGDAVMAIFNVPIQHPDHASHAVAAAMEIQSKMPALRERFGLDLKARVAIASGTARVGQLGSRSRKDYTAIGEAVNLASRLEGQARAGEIVLHDAVYQQVADDFPGIEPEAVTLKGFGEPVTAYRLVMEKDGQPMHYHLPHLEEHSDGSPQRSVGVGSMVFALLAAPCAAGAALSPAALVLGMGSAFTTLQSSLLAPFDLPYVRLPLQGVALTGVAANLYTLWRARRSHQQKQAKGAAPAMTGKEQVRNVLVASLAGFTVVAILAEVYAHYFGMM